MQIIIKFNYNSWSFSSIHATFCHSLCALLPLKGSVNCHNGIFHGRFVDIRTFSELHIATTFLLVKVKKMFL